MPAVVVTPEEVVKAFRSDPRFQDSTHFEMYRPTIESLPSIIGPELMDEEVTIERLLVLVADVADHMIETKVGRTELNGSDYLILQQSFQATSDLHRESVSTVQSLLDRHGITERQLFMTPGQTTLNDEARRLYGEGQLTWAALLRTCPGVLIPTASN